jgi:uncharacterized lipoprotein NlpE involved in copper resistance
MHRELLGSIKNLSEDLAVVDCRVLVAAVALGISTIACQNRTQEQAAVPKTNSWSCFKSESVSLSAREGSIVVTNRTDKSWTHLKLIFEEEQENSDFEYQYEGTLEPGMELAVGA